MTSKSKTTKTRWTCILCGRDGHLAKDCPAPKDEDGRPILDSLTEVEARKAAIVAAWKDLGMGRLGKPGLAAVLAYVKAGPTTSYDLGRDFGLRDPQVPRDILCRMGELGLLHTEGAVRVRATAPAVPVWGYGPGEVVRSGTAVRRQLPELVHFKLIIKTLEQPLTVDELSEATGANKVALYELVRFMHRIGMAHRFGWAPPPIPQGGGLPAAVWLFGPGKDARRPARVIQKEACRRYQAGQRARKAAMAITNAIAGIAVGQAAGLMQ